VRIRWGFAPPFGKFCLRQNFGYAQNVRQHTQKEVKMKTRVIMVLLVSVVPLALLRGIASGVSSSPRQELEGVSALPVGPLAVTYENCDADQIEALKAALEGILHTKKQCGDEEGKIGDDLLECLYEKEENITIKCGGGSCDKDETVEGAAPIGGDYVRICNQTFNNAQRLEAVLFHELVHSCGRNENDRVAEACQNACYGDRGATPPDRGEEGGSCNGSGSASAMVDTRLVSPQNLSLEGTITSEKRAYAYGEPITITFQLQNIAATGIITVNKSWYNPNINSLAIFDSEGQQWKSLILWEMRPPDLTNFVALSPGDVFSDTFAVSAEFYGVLIPDFYTLTVTYTNWYTGHFTLLYPYTFIGDIGAWTGTLRTNDLRIFVYLQKVYLPLVVKNYAP
jgi:hypothetical protein